MFSSANILSLHAEVIADLIWYGAVYLSRLKGTLVMKVNASLKQYLTIFEWVDDLRPYCGPPVSEGRL